MKIAAVYALANLAQKEVPQYVNDIYKQELHFSKDYLIPKPFDKRLLAEVASAVALAAIKSGVSSATSFNADYYQETTIQK